MCLCALGCFASNASAADRYWVAASAGSWSNTANWATTSGGLGGQSVPGAADDVYFDAGSTQNCSVNCATDSTIASWTQSVGYSGNVTFFTTYAGAFQTFTITGNAVVSGGIWTHPANEAGRVYRLNVAVGGALTVAAGGSINAVAKGYAANQGMALATTIAISATDNTNGDQTTFIDAVELVPVNVPSFSNASFETPSVAGGSGFAAPAGAGWTFVGPAAMQHNGSVWGASSAPDGVQAALLQGHSVGGLGSIVQSITLPSGMYHLRFRMAYRSGYASQSVQLAIDGQARGGVIAASSTTYQTYTTASFASLGEPVSVSLSATDMTDDRTAFVDEVEIISDTTPTFVNAGFELPAQTTAPNYSYGPYTAGWTFNDRAVVERNGCAWGAPNAVEGIQAAALQSTGGASLGSVTQVINIPAGSWRLRFSAARRSVGPNQPVRVTVNGSAVGADYLPSSTAWESHLSAVFTVGAQAVSGNGGAQGGRGGFGAGVSGSSGPTYGVPTAPIEPGTGYFVSSGTIPHGGGAIHLSVNGLTTIDGSMVADGEVASGANGGGSGGSILFQGASFAGTGIIRAAGGGGSGTAGGGGGGRIAVTLSSGNTFGTTVITAAGGAALGSGGNGAAGTVYREGAAQGAGLGLLSVDNLGLTTLAGVVTALNDVSAATGVGENISVTIGSLVVQNRGSLLIGSGDALTLNSTGTTATIAANSTLANQGNLILGGTTFSIAGSTNFSASGNTVTYIGQSDDSGVSLIAGPYHHLTLNQAGTTFTQTAAALILAGNLTLSAGTLVSGGQDLSVAGNWTNSDTYVNGGNTVTLNGAGGSTQIISGTTTFHHLTATCSIARTLQFEATKTQMVSGTLTLVGTSGQLLRLRSTASPGTWSIAPTGVRTCQFVDVQDGINTVSPAISPTSSTDRGNTVLWFGSDRYWVSGKVPLDQMSTSAAAAYGLRQLRAGYAGAAVRAWKAGPVTQDIGFTATGDLDTSALLAFAGSGSAFVTTWYDQSGYGYDAVQTTPSSMPRIVNSGSIERQNGRPTLRFLGGSEGLITSGVPVAASPLAVHGVMAIAGNTGGAFMKLGGANGIGLGVGSSTFDSAGMTLVGLKELVIWDPSSLTIPTGNATILGYSVPASGATTFWCNGASANGSTQAILAPTSMMWIGGYGSRSPACTISEALAFSAQLSTADRQAMETSQASYYAVPGYAVGSAVAWSTQANWSNSSGGIGGASMPTSTGAAYFDAQSITNVVLDVTPTVASLTMDAGYTGTCDFNTRTLTITGAADLRSGGVFTGTTGGVNLNGNGAQTLTPPTSGTIPNLTHSGTGTATIATNDLSLTGNLTISAGVLDGGGKDIRVPGNWTNLAGFNAGSGAVIFTGAGSSTQIIAGNTTFNAFTATGSTTRTLQFTNGSAQTVLGTLTLQGATNNRLNLRSTSAGASWILDAQGTRTCSALDVQDGNNLTAPAILPTASRDAGNNSLWFPTTRYWSHPLLDLDAFPATPAVAYSMRLVRSGYTGPALRIRRASDNQESDIGFTLAGNLDMTALLAFVGAGNGYVRTWYDQSASGRHAFQVTASNQPRLVNAGVVDMAGAQPALKFDGSTSFLNVPNTLGAVGSNVTFSFVVKPGTAMTGLWDSAPQQGNPVRNYHFEIGTGYSDRWEWWDGAPVITLGVPIGSVSMLSFVHTLAPSRQITYALNGSVVGTYTDSSTTGIAWSSACIGTVNRGEVWFNGSLSEALILGSAVSVPDRERIECSQSSYYLSLGNWSNRGFWSHQSGGQGDAPVPGLGNAVYFDANGLDPCLLDVAAQAASLSFSTGYTGVLNFGTQSIACAGHADLRSGGTFVGTTGNLNLNGSGAQTLTPPPSGTIPNLTKSGSGTATLAVNDLSVASDVTISAGVLASGGKNLSLPGNWTNSGTFTAGAGTVSLTGAGGSTQVVSGSTTFNNLTATCTSARTLQFAAGSTQTILGGLTFTGATAQRLSLRSTMAGSQWRMDPQGTRSCTYVDVRDGNNVRLPLILPVSSVDSGGTTWWFGQTLALCWDGATSGAIEGQTSAVSWNLGVLALGEVRTSGSGIDATQVFAVRNAGDQPAQITASAASSGWAIAPLPGYEQATVAVAPAATFTSLDSTTSPAGSLLQANLTAGSSQLFRIQIGAPTATTQGGNAQTLTITLNASPPP